MADNTNQSLEPLNALLHPVWLVALVLLVFNDHFLKASELWPALSGKMSDFAGLLVAPVLLAAVLRVKTNRGLWLSAAATGFVFAAINLSPLVAGIWDALVSTVVPYRTTVDPTDLVALTMLPVGLLLFGPSMRATMDRSRAKRTAQIVAAAFGFVMCTATSSDDSCTTQEDCNYDGDVCMNGWCAPEDEPTMSETSDTDSTSMSMDLVVDELEVDELETSALDDVSKHELQTLSVESLDPALVGYLLDDGAPLQ